MAQHASPNRACSGAGVAEMDGASGLSQRDAERDRIPDCHGTSAAGVSSDQAGRSPPHLEAALTDARDRFDFCQGSGDLAENIFILGVFDSDAAQKFVFVASAE